LDKTRRRLYKEVVLHINELSGPKRLKQFLREREPDFRVLLRRANSSTEESAEKAPASGDEKRASQDLCSYTQSAAVAENGRSGGALFRSVGRRILVATSLSSK
jgi:hypothetical protein